MARAHKWQVRWQVRALAEGQDKTGSENRKGLTAIFISRYWPSFRAIRVAFLIVTPTMSSPYRGVFDSSHMIFKHAHMKIIVQGSF